MFICNQKTQEQKQTRQIANVAGLDSRLSKRVKKNVKKIVRLVKKTIAPVLTESTKLVSSLMTRKAPKMKPEAEVVLTTQEIADIEAKKAAQKSPIMATLREYTVPMGVGAAILVSGIVIYLILRKKSQR